MGDDFTSKIHPSGMMNLRPHDQNPPCVYVRLRPCGQNQANNSICMN